jgi:hypothetical protein
MSSGPASEESVKDLVQALGQLHISSAGALTVNITINQTTSSSTEAVPEYPLPEEPLAAVASSSTAARTEPSAATGTAAASSVPPPGGLTRAQREALADRIGLWVRGKLSGAAVGPSGRKTLKLSNSVWIVFKDFEGSELVEPAIFKTYGQARPLAERAGELGESLVIGLATEWEATRVLAAAGHAWKGYA